MTTAEYYVLSGHLFEVVPTRGNGHVGYLKESTDFPATYEVSLMTGGKRYFKVSNKSRGSFVEIEEPIENVLPLKTA